MSYTIKCRGAKCNSYGKMDLLTGITIYINNCESEHMITIKSKAKFFYYNKLLTILKKENLEDSNFQKYIVEEIILNNKTINNNDDVRNKFYELTNQNLILTNITLSKIKYKIRGLHNNLSFEEILLNITNFDKSLKLQLFRKDFLTQDNIKSNFFILCSDDMINVLKNEKNDYFQYFSDTTFRIIPDKYKNFKLLVILAFNIKFKKTEISALIFYQKMDEYTFIKIFQELNNTFNFNPKIINVDFQKSQIKALYKVYKCNISINTCFYHLEQSLIRKAIKLLIFQKDNNNILRELFLNFSIIAFQEPLDAFKRFNLIKKKYQSYNEFSALLNYMNKQWVNKKNILLWNYNDLLNNLGNNWPLIFITNNICESFNKLLNKYLNVGKTSISSFITSISSVIKLYKNKIEKNIRKDSKSRFLINLAENIGFNELLTYDIFKKLEIKFNSESHCNFNYTLYTEEDNELEKTVDNEYNNIYNNYKSTMQNDKTITFIDEEINESQDNISEDIEDEDIKKDSSEKNEINDGEIDSEFIYINNIKNDKNIEVVIKGDNNLFKLTKLEIRNIIDNNNDDTQIESKSLKCKKRKYDDDSYDENIDLKKNKISREKKRKKK